MFYILSPGAFILAILWFVFADWNKKMKFRRARAKYNKEHQDDIHAVYTPSRWRSFWIKIKVKLWLVRVRLANRRV